MKPGSIGATSVTVTLTASEVGTLFWALYTDGSAVADAAALINDATADPKPNTVVSRSATATVVDSTTDAVEIVLTGLTKSTSYDFYAVLQDGAANIGALSPKLEITTTTTKPTFTAGPHLRYYHRHQRHHKTHRKRGRDASSGSSMQRMHPHQQTLGR